MIAHEIKKILDREQYFLMYRAGAGGEFLSDLITSHTTRFRKVESNYHGSVNRTQINLPKFYQCFTAVKTKDKSLDVLIDKIIKAHTIFGYDLQSSIDEANYFLDNGKPPLIRIHYTFTDYFTKNNTWLLIQDDIKWFEYTSNLYYLKSGLSPIPREEIKSIFYYPLANTPKYKEKIDGALQYIETNNIEKVYQVQYEPLICDPNEFSIGYDELFSTKPEDLIKKYGSFFDQPYSKFYATTMEKIGNRVNIIPFSKIFVPGFLENLFNLDSSVTDEIENWHRKNLLLLNSYDFETAKYMV